MMMEKIYSEWMGETQRKKISHILTKVDVKGKVLDIGAGPGFLEEFIDAIAVDIDLENLKKAKGKKILADGNNLPFKNDSFDTIFCIDTIHLIDNIENIEDLLKKDGRLIVTLFCNEYNFKDRIDYLKGLFSLDIEKEFTVRTEKEWDAVIVFKK
ncbi:MAG: class I SAM-dependent methyltransferase [Candidatus Aenigmarchaeota archaeon]|nr:class I SAM-dependent methyltransferase [Candidatus Aenigmarchaeota archaeon]